jgi:TPR repeat protein
LDATADAKVKKAVSSYLLDVHAFDRGADAYGRGDYAMAVREWKPQADKGNALAALRMAGMYVRGEGAAPDDAEAARYYRRAVEFGNAEGQASLGAMYVTGRGVAQDNREAARLFRLAADRGDPLGQSNLGGFCETGTVVQQDDPEALKWCGLAARQGSPQCLNHLVVLYFKGRAVSTNRVVAFALFSLSAEMDGNASNHAVANKDKLAAILGSQEIAEGKRLTRQLVAPGNVISALDRANR